MASGKSVHFYGKESVLEAAENRGCICWAIFAGSGRDRQFLFKCDPADKHGSHNTMEMSLQYLGGILDALVSSKAIYTIQFYEDLKPGDKIKHDTAYDGSFNFISVEQEEHTERIPDYYQRAGGGSSKIMGFLERMDSRMESLEKKFSEVEETEEPEQKDIADIALGYLENPDKIGKVVSIFQSLFSGAPAAMNGMHPQRVGALPGTAAGAPKTTTEIPQSTGATVTPEGLTRLSAALDILGKNDPLIVEHLEKLAHMSESNKSTFNFLISSLDRM